MPDDVFHFDLWRKGYLDVQRPTVYFGNERARPEVIRMAVTPPPLLFEAFDGDLDRLIYHLQKLREESVRKARARRSKPALGARALRRLHPWSEPRSLRERGGQRVPTFSIGTRGVLARQQNIRAATEVRLFRATYRHVRIERRNGNERKRYPLGSYAVRVVHGTPVEANAHRDAMIAWGCLPALLAVSERLPMPGRCPHPGPLSPRSLSDLSPDHGKVPERGALELQRALAKRRLAPTTNNMWRVLVRLCAVLLIGVALLVVYGAWSTTSAPTARLLISVCSSLLVALGLLGLLGDPVAVLSRAIYQCPPSRAKWLLPLVAIAGRELAILSPGGASRILTLDLKVDSLYFTGQSPEATTAATELAQLIIRRRDLCPWPLVNTIVNAWIAAGKYQAALALPDAWSGDALTRGRDEFRGEYALVMLNLAEAEYNLGRLNRSVALLEIAEVYGTNSELVINGVRQQRAWVEALAGNVQGARLWLALVEESAFPPAYRAETCFTQALIALKSGQLADAETFARQGLERGVRASSDRNGLFLLARITLAQGDPQQAAALFERGIAHRYRGQGGDSILEYAQWLEQTSQPKRAAETYRLVLTRDPESPACEEAKLAIARLAS